MTFGQVFGVRLWVYVYRAVFGWTSAGVMLLLLLLHTLFHFLLSIELLGWIDSLILMVDPFILFFYFL